MNFKITRRPFGDFESITLETPDGDDILTVCNYGATVTAYQMQRNNTPVDILLPYETPEQLIKGEGAVNWIMAPFSNRMREGKYSFKEKTYLLDEKSGKSHGLVKKLKFHIDEIASNQNEAIITFFTEITPDMFSAYPFTLSASVTYIFRPGSLDITITGTNLSTTSVPYSCGWHPYFSFKEHGINSLKLIIPSVEIVKTDENLVPLLNGYIEQLRPGHPKYFADDESPEVLYTKSINACYTNLKTNNKGMIESKLIDTENKTVFTLYQQRGVFYAYTPENLRGEQRKSIALEPVEFMTDAFNRPELQNEIILAQGEKRSFNFGISREILH